MATKEKQLGEVYLKDVRLSFPHLWEKTSAVEGGKKKFRASFLIDPAEDLGKANIAALKKARREVEEDEFKKSPMKYKDDRCCIKRGDDVLSGQTGEPYAGYEGKIVIGASNDNRPTILNKKIKGRKAEPLTEDDDVLYAGCRVDAIVRLWGTKKKEQGGIGLFASLEGVMFRREDEAFGAAPVSGDAFEDVDDEDGGFGDDEDEDDDEDDDELLG